MQQMLVVLADNADADTVSKAINDNSGALDKFLDSSVLLVDGDENVRSALAQTTGVLAVISDDDAKTAANAQDLLQLDITGLATWVGATLGTNTSYDEPIVLAISGWMYGLSDAYASRKSDRPREGETWDMDGGCLPTDEPFANA